MLHFKNIDNIKKASVDEIASVKNIPEKVAHTIYEYMHES